MIEDIQKDVSKSCGVCLDSRHTPHELLCRFRIRGYFTAHSGFVMYQSFWFCSLA